MKPFSDNLRQLRTEKGLSVLTLGRAIGVSDSAICNWENDITDIKSEYIIKLANYFEVSSDYLLGLNIVKEK